MNIKVDCRCDIDMVKEFIRGIIESLQKHEKCFLQVNLFTFQKQAKMFFVSQFDLP